MERILREHAIKTVRPIYPADALRNRQTGVVVVNARITNTGEVSGVQVLEAPSESIAVSVSQAVARWRFTPILGFKERPEAVSGKLTFYFEMINRNGVVLDPQEAGYVGRWHQKLNASRFSPGDRR
jgi:TonB family protein